MRNYLFSLLLFILFLEPASSFADDDYKVVGYYVSWAARRKPAFTPKEINGNLLTHLNYAFAKVDASGQISLLSPKDDLGLATNDWKTVSKYQGNLLQFKNLKKKIPPP